MDEFGPTPPVLTRKMCEKAYERLVQHPDEQRSELIDLNHAPTFKKLPPAYVVTAQYDVLRDEGEYFAARLFKNNVPVSDENFLQLSEAPHPHQQYRPPALTTFHHVSTAWATCRCTVVKSSRSPLSPLIGSVNGNNCFVVMVRHASLSCRQGLKGMVARCMVSYTSIHWQRSGVQSERWRMLPLPCGRL